MSTYYFEYGRHVARQHRRCCRRRAYAPTSNSAAHDNHGKINSWVSFSPYGYGARRLTSLRAAGAPLKMALAFLKMLNSSETKEVDSIVETRINIYEYLVRKLEFQVKGIPRNCIAHPY